LRRDVTLCRSAAEKAVPERGIKSISAAFFGIDHTSGVATNNCLLSRGWEPKIQFAGSFGATTKDLEDALQSCGAEGGYSGLMAKAEFSGMVAENIINHASTAINGSPGMKEVAACLSRAGWRIVNRPPWIPPNEAVGCNVADPIAESIAEKFVVKDEMIRDNGKGIYWMQDGPEGGRSVDWHDARHYVIGLNSMHFKGYDDWRIPRRDEVDSLLNFARWNAASDMAALLKKLGFNGIEGAVYWTSSPIWDDATGAGIWGVNFSTREYVRLGRSDAFSANVLPVRGRGWGSREPELPLHEPTDKKGHGEVIAARYHHYKTSGDLYGK
jgi:hypothetical protein